MIKTAYYADMANTLWKVADLLRGDFKQSQYGRIILPFTLLRRMECVLAPTKAAVLAAMETHAAKPELVREKLLLQASGQQFYNTSRLSLGTLSTTQTAADLLSYVQSFSQNAREIFENFNFEDFIDQLNTANLLFQVVKAFKKENLHPVHLSNFEMGLVFEELIRRFAESSNETAGEHFTPRDIVHLTTSLVLTGQDERLQAGKVITIYDPTAGTGGFLSESDEYIQQVSAGVTVRLYGQELNPESYAICEGDMLIKGQDIDNVKLGNTLSEDKLIVNEHSVAKEKLTFTFMLSNPPFGVDWKKVQKVVTDEHKVKGFNGRFGAGLPRVSDGSLLFLQHLLSKMMMPQDGGSRIGIVLNGSPLFTGGAGSGESEIRRYVLQYDLLEAIVALPTDMFYNTGIGTYIWILSNVKPAERQGKVQLINATGFASKMRKSLGSKRQFLDEAAIAEIVRLYGDFEPAKECLIFENEAFGYRRITVERPLRLRFGVDLNRVGAGRIEDLQGFKNVGVDEIDAILRGCALIEGQSFLSEPVFLKALAKALSSEGVRLTAAQLQKLGRLFSERDPAAEPCAGKQKGSFEPDSQLRDFENVPLGEDVFVYFAREVLPHVPDAWIDEGKRDALDEEIGVVGFEIPFNRHFYEFVPPRPLAVIDAELTACTDKIKAMIAGLSV